MKTCALTFVYLRLKNCEEALNSDCIIDFKSSQNL